MAKLNRFECARYLIIAGLTLANIAGYHELAKGMFAAWAIAFIVEIMP